MPTETVPFTVRLPTDVHAHLAAHCKASGAVMNRVVVLSVKSWLGVAPPALQLEPPDEEREETGFAPPTSGTEHGRASTRGLM